MGLEKNKVNRTLGVILILLIIAFGGVILLQLSSIFLGPSKKACTKKICLSKFLEGPPAFNDDRLKSYLNERYYYKSKGPQNYSEKIGYNSTIEEAAVFILDHFQKKRGGTFAVIGAGDGEYQDFTIPLEKHLGWTGLLIEPHPDLFELLKKKGRNAILSNNCVSPFAYPSMTSLGHPQVNVIDTPESKLKKYRATKIKQLFEDDTDIVGLKVQCVPLENLLYAAGIEKEFDLLVLDMNGSDLDVLVNIKMDRIPDIEMVVLRSHGQNIGSDAASFFLDKNLVLKKVIGDKPEGAIYIITKFRGETEL